ncbi:MAG: glycosyltransferase family 39 protein, partial [Acidobacteriota bacterium]
MTGPAAPRVPLIERHYLALAVAVLALAAFNVTFRLGREVVTEWDESLYALSAWEMVKSGYWVATTYGGALDYYNTKPPLNVWLIAFWFKTFGVSLVALRITSALSAWLTVLLLQGWLRRSFGAMVAIVGSLVLATCFGFLYAHAGRSGNPDALFALLVLLTVMTASATQEHPWRQVWLGPLLAAVFLLKGMAVLMPLSIVAAIDVWQVARKQRHRSWVPLLSALCLFALPVATWMWARWQVDQWRFIRLLFEYDFVLGTFTSLEGHSGTPLFYLNVLQRDQLAWLVVAGVALIACPIGWRQLRDRLPFWGSGSGRGMLLGTWALATFLIPTLMRTKLPWYLNCFYPAFAAGVDWLVSRALSSPGHGGSTRWRRAAVGAAVA